MLINTGVPDIFGLHLCLGGKGGPLGRGCEKGQELEFGEKGVEVGGDFGEASEGGAAGLSE